VGEGMSVGGSAIRHIDGLGFEGRIGVLEFGCGILLFLHSWRWREEDATVLV
jgi:hypothetical protein